MADEQRIEHLPRLLEELATMLESAEPTRTLPSTRHAAQLNGIRLRELGYTLPLLATHVRLVGRAVNDVIHENLMSLNLSYFMFDVKRLHDSLGLQLEHSLNAFVATEHATVVERNRSSPQT